MNCPRENVGLLQSFIHLMNDMETRNEIMAYHMRQSTTPCRWWGTWFVRVSGNHSLTLTDTDPVWKYKPTSLQDLVRHLDKKKRSASTLCMFTVCLQYDAYSVHYVSFVYKDRTLLSFDPGVRVYPHGQKTIVPRIQKLMESLQMIDTHRVEGACTAFCFRQKKHGVQFNGRVHQKLPADAFCQTWTVFFLVRLFSLTDASIESMSSLVQRWCSIPPGKREYFLMTMFILPTLTYFPKVMKKLGGKEVMEALLAPVEQCFFSSPPLR